VRILFYLLLSGLAHFLAARWLLSTFSPSLRARWRRTVLGVAAVLSLLLATTRLLASVHETEALRALASIVALELGAVTLALLPIGLMSGAARGFRRLRPGPQAPAQKSETLTRRQAIERAVGASLVGATTATLGWGMVRGRHAFALEELVVRVKGWPRVLDGYLIAQVSDVHVGTFVGDRELDEGFELVTKLRPDLVVATGDLVDFDSGAVGPLALRLLRAGARDGAYAILGNHDHYAGAAEVASRLRAAGVGVLSNESVRLRAGDGGGFALLGVDDLQGRTGRSPGFSGPDLRTALRGLPPSLPRILLAHQPKYFDESSGRVALQLSGHTHGGQINPGFRPVDAFMKYVAGRYDAGDSTLYVNRGFGVSGPPSRVGAPPEVTKIVIVSA
jgi:predicted MPP superfamily phosphohydrolase